MKPLPCDWSWGDPANIGDPIACAPDGESTAWIEEDGSLAVGGADGVAAGYVPREVVLALFGVKTLKRRRRR